MRNSRSRLIAVSLTMMSALTLAGCTISDRAPVNFLELSSVNAPLPGAKGKTVEDQRKIDRTIAAACKTGVLGSEQCDRHTIASAQRLAELRAAP